MKTILLLAAALVGGPSSATEFVIACPARYPLEDVKLAPSANWDVGLLTGQLALRSAGMAIGPLAQRGELRGSEQRIKNGYRTRFGFESPQAPPEKWFLCYYASGGTVQLVRRLADTVRECTLTQEQRKFPQEPNIQIRCE